MSCSHAKLLGTVCHRVAWRHVLQNVLVFLCRGWWALTSPLAMRHDKSSNMGVGPSNGLAVRSSHVRQTCFRIPESIVMARTSRRQTAVLAILFLALGVQAVTPDSGDLASYRLVELLRPAASLAGRSCVGASWTCWRVRSEPAVLPDVMALASESPERQEESPDEVCGDVVMVRVILAGPKASGRRPIALPLVFSATPQNQGHLHSGSLRHQGSGCELSQVLCRMTC